MSTSTPSERLYRVNLMLRKEESDWLDQLAHEIYSTTGAKVSRSEIVRAAIAGLRELHHLDPVALPSLARCNSGAALTAVAIVAARCAASWKPGSV